MKMSQSTNIVLLACGSFNPITNSHLRMFELAKDYFNRKPNHKVVKGIISPVNDLYKTEKKLESSKHRCEMIRKSLIPFEKMGNWIELDDWESQLNQWSRTVDVLDHHYNRINTETPQPNIHLKLLCGADLFDSFKDPELWTEEEVEKIVGKYGLVVNVREGFDPWETIQDSNKSSIFFKHKENMHIISEKFTNSISSTAIREAIKNGESIRYLVQDPVIEYIEKNRLYR